MRLRVARPVNWRAVPLDDDDSSDAEHTNEGCRFCNTLVVQRGTTLQHIDLPAARHADLQLFDVPVSHPAFPGRGVRATRAIACDEEIGYYAGVLRLGSLAPDNAFVIAVDAPSLDLVIDALCWGNALRYLNDPRGMDTAANVKALESRIKVRSASYPCVVIVAARDIAAGEELLLPYEASNTGYWAMHSSSANAHSAVEALRAAVETFQSQQTMFHHKAAKLLKQAGSEVNDAAGVEEVLAQALQIVGKEPKPKRVRVTSADDAENNHLVAPQIVVQPSAQTLIAGHQQQPQVEVSKDLVKKSAKVESKAVEEKFEDVLEDEPNADEEKLEKDRQRDEGIKEQNVVAVGGKVADAPETQKKPDSTVSMLAPAKTGSKSAVATDVPGRGDDEINFDELVRVEYFAKRGMSHYELEEKTILDRATMIRYYRPGFEPGAAMPNQVKNEQAAESRKSLPNSNVSGERRLRLAGALSPGGLSAPASFTQLIQHLGSKSATTQRRSIGSNDGEQRSSIESEARLKSSRVLVGSDAALAPEKIVGNVAAVNDTKALVSSSTGKEGEAERDDPLKTNAAASSGVESLKKKAKISDPNNDAQKARAAVSNAAALSSSSSDAVNKATPAVSNAAALSSSSSDAVNKATPALPVAEKEEVDAVIASNAHVSPSSNGSARKPPAGASRGTPIIILDDDIDVHDAKVDHSDPVVEPLWQLVGEVNARVAIHGLVLQMTCAQQDAACQARGSFGWTVGVHEWAVTLTKVGSGLRIGVCLTDMYVDEVAEGSDVALSLRVAPDKVWYIDSEGDARCGENIVTKVFGDGPLRAGSVLNVQVDLNRRCITFGRNGRWKSKPAFKDLADHRYFPYFRLVGDQEIRVRISK